MARLVILGAAVAVYFTLAPRWPKTNVIHVVLGVASAEVDELRIGYAPARGEKGSLMEDWTRVASFRFPSGRAPRIVTHEPRLADGDYVVEIEIVKASRQSVTVDRRVTLQGGSTSIDVTEVLSR
jgi:hypothetical protein